MATYDVAPYQGVSLTSGLPLVPSLFGEDGLSSALSGPLKVCQQFLVDLFTIAGSIPHEPDRGVDFYAQLLSGKARTVLDVRLAFSAAGLTIRNRWNTLLTGQEADDEILQKATLVGAWIDADKLTLRINITTQAGDGVKVELPIKTTP